MPKKTIIDSLMTMLGDGALKDRLADLGAPPKGSSGGAKALQIASAVEQILVRGSMAETLSAAGRAAADALLDFGKSVLQDGRGATQTPNTAARGASVLSSGSGVDSLLDTPTDGADSLVGTPAADIIDALDGNDSVQGLGGNDTLLGASGGDRLWGGDNDDIVYGGLGDDYVEGNAGVDVLYGGEPPVSPEGNDVLVNSTNALNDGDSWVAALPNGGYVVGWAQQVGASIGLERVLLQRFDADGNKVGPQIDFDLFPTHEFQAKGEIQITALQGVHAGEFVVVWYSRENPPSGVNEVHSAFMARYGSDGVKIGATVELSPDQPYTHSRPSVTALPDGNVMVTWQDQWRDSVENGENPLNEGWGIYGQHWHVSAGGMNASSGDLHISVEEANNQALPQMTTLSNGDVVVAWLSDAPSGNPGQTNVMYRILNPQTGFPTFTTGELRANWTASGPQTIDGKGLTALNGGGFVIAWYGEGTDAVSGTADTQGVFFQVFNNAGQRLDANGLVVTDPLVNSERLLANTTANPQLRPALTSLPDGGFFAVWEGPASALGDGSGNGLIGQRFDALGNKLGDEILINQLVPGDQLRPNLTTLADGTVMVTWTGPGITGTDSDVFTRRVRFGSSDVGGNDTMLGGDAADRIFGEEGDDKLYGENSADSLSGGSGADTLYGGNAIDLLFGGIGEDTMEGGVAADSINGGAGRDYASYIGSAAAVRVNLSDNVLESNGDAQGDFLTLIENLIGSSFADILVGRGLFDSVDEPSRNTLIGAAGDDALYGLSGLDYLRGDTGSDLMEGGSGADTLNGGSGADTASYLNSAVGVTVDIGDTLTETGGDAQGDFLTFVENISGSDLADTLRGDANNNSLFGNGGNDSLEGRSGADVLNGDHGNDTMFGGSGTDQMLGGAANDWLSGGLGADLLNGEAGDDVADYTNSSAVTIVLGDGNAELGGEAEGDQLTSVEFILGGNDGDRITTEFGTRSVFGNTGNDILVGVTGAQLLSGGVGDDTLRGGSGSDVLNGTVGTDTLAGEAGADQMNGGADLDWADYTASVVGVTVTLGMNGAQTGAAGGHQVGDTLTNMEAAFGSSTHDTFVSLTAAAIFSAGDGDDSLIAGSGTESFIGGSGSDWIDYRASATGVTVNFVSGIGSGGLAAGDLYNGVENARGSGASDSLIGSSAVNTLLGFTGDDRLFGFSGGDSLAGDIGDDTINGGSGADRIDGGADSAGDYLSFAGETLGVSANLDTGLGHTNSASGDSYISIEHILGGGGNDTLVGNNAINTLRGADGGDSLHGGGRADVLLGDDGGDVVFYDALDTGIMGGTGRDVLIGTNAADFIQLNEAKWHFNLGFASFERVNLGLGNDYFLGSSNAADYLAYDLSGVEVYGGSGVDYISMRGYGAVRGIDDGLYGGTGDDFLWGGAGMDTLSGGVGHDGMYGGGGNDTIFGGDGFDVTYHGRNEGNDLIVDSEGLVLFWGNDLSTPGTYDGVDPSEVLISYNTGAEEVTITFTDGSSGSVTFGFGDVQILNLFDFHNQSEGNSGPPPAGLRDIWTASWDAGTNQFTAWSKEIDS